MRGTSFYGTVLVLAAAAVVIVAAIFAMSPGPPAAPSGSLAAAELSLTVTTDRPFYSPREIVNITVQLHNPRNVTAKLDFGSSCQVTYRVEDGGGSTAYDWSAHHGCLAMLTNLSLPPGAHESYEFSWDQLSDDGVPVLSGQVYRVIARLLNWPPPSVADAESEFVVEMTAEAQTLNLAFSAETDRIFYSPGDWANVSITLTNLDVWPVTLAFGNPCFMAFLVYTSDGSVVYNTTGPEFCIQVYARITLQPGESTTQVFRWNLTDDRGVPLSRAHWYTVVPRFRWHYADYQQHVTRTDDATFYLAP